MCRLYERLKARKILVRYMEYGPLGDGLRISVGSDEEIDRLIDELNRLVRLPGGTRPIEPAGPGR